MLLINREINLILSWSKDCVISAATEATKFAITDTKFYIPVVTLLNQVSKEQLTEININQKFQQKGQTNIQTF